MASFPGGIHLILGGKDKIQKRPQRLSRYCAGGFAPFNYNQAAASKKTESHLRGVTPIHSSETLANAVSAAASAARPGDVVLLAPACSKTSISLKITSSAGGFLSNWLRT